MAWVQWSRTGRWGRTEGQESQGSTCERVHRKCEAMQKEVAPSLRGARRVFQGGWSGQQGQALL